MTYREPGKQKPSSDEDQLEIPCASDYRDIMHTFADGGFDPEFNKRRIKLILESVKKNMQKILVESQEHATSETSTVRIKIKLPVSRNECVHSAEQTHKAIRKSFGDVMLLLQKEGGWEECVVIREASAPPFIPVGLFLPFFQKQKRYCFEVMFKLRSDQ